MDYAREIISKHPEVKGNINEALVRSVEEVLACAQTCIACADACLGEQTVGADPVHSAQPRLCRHLRGHGRTHKPAHWLKRDGDASGDRDLRHSVPHLR